MDGLSLNWHSSPKTLPDALTVTQLNNVVKRSLEQCFDKISVIGEIANYSRPMSGHIYFTLKDSTCELRCVLFRMRQLTDYIRLLKDGVAVELTGQITLYAQKGHYQMIVESLRLQGEGLLKQQFLALKNRLQEQGLFEESIKKPLPKYPQMIGVISSPTAAGLTDFITILGKRYPACHVRLFSSPVQGAHAAECLMQALRHAQSDPEVDVIVFCRGGGSLEDMWCFNDEQLAQAIFQCTKPVVSAIGHEKDITICDLCADVRAATPTNAAMLVASDLNDLSQTICQYTARLTTLIQHTIQTKQLHLSKLQSRICHPHTRIVNSLHKLADYTERLSLLVNQRYRQSCHLHQQLASRLNESILRHRTEHAKLLVQNCQQRLQKAMSHHMLQQRLSLRSLCHQIDALNPETVLKRGYGITKRSNQIIHSVTQVQPNDHITITLQDGSFTASVLESESEVA